jgi:alanine racemase
MKIASPSTISAMGNADPGAGAGAVLTIDLAALAENWRTLARHCETAECAAVVKADAYGLGIEPAASALHRAGARTFFVALLSEAERLRAALPDAVIYVLNGLPPGTAKRFTALDLRPVLGSPDEIAEWAPTGLPAALHIDTGMNRLGLTTEEARAFAAAPTSRPALVMSHLACADEPDHPLNAVQAARFREIAALFAGVPASLANSAATLLGAPYRFDLCRPGIALYGSNPIPSRQNPMRPVVGLDARIVQVRDVPAGESVGYGAAHIVRRDSRVAVLSLGYADGIIRAGGGSDDHPGAVVMAGGIPCPLIGRISMDLIAVDITDAPGLSRGERIEILGAHRGVDDLAAAAGTIGYEILTGLGRRYRRVYRD